MDIDYFKLNLGLKLVLFNLDLFGVDELVIYVVRGMELYRGFLEFIEAIVYI